jgi:GNAT superfamily N-acetyltransferase
MDTVEIRKMRAEDLARCARILEAAYSLPPYEEKFTPDVASEYLRHKFVYCTPHSFVAEKAGKVVGFLLSSLSVWVEGGQAIIEEIVVEPPEQGQGCGTAMMAAAEGYLREKGVHSVMLWGRRDAPAHGFYKGKGFDDSDEWVIMHKAL